jgi:hypothetical protein
VVKASKPVVDLRGKSDDAGSVTLTFAIDRTVAPSLVRILNEGTNSVTLNGTIENPIGTTDIRNTGGSVLASNPRGTTDGTTQARSSLIVTNVLNIQTPGAAVAPTGPRINVDLVQAAGFPMATSFVKGRVSGSDDTISIGRHVFFTGMQVVYNAAGSPITGLTSGTSYWVVVVPDSLRIKLATSAALTSFVDLDQGSSAATAPHTLTPVTRFHVEAEGNIGLDVRGVLRQAGALVAQHQVVLDHIRSTSGTIDLVIRPALQQTGEADSQGILVKYPVGASETYYTSFRGGTSRTKLSGAVYGTGTDTVATKYTLKGYDAAGQLTLPGVIAGGSILVTASNAADDAPRVEVDALTQITHSGHIDVTTNGLVTVEEVTGDLRVGRIESTRDSVILRSPERILDALADAGADVLGENITMTAGTGGAQGGIGTPLNFLEIDVDHVAGDGNAGKLKATDTAAASTDGIYVTDTAGDLPVDLVTTTADVSLATTDGSILDADNDAAADVQGDTVDLHAGGTGSIGGLRSDGTANDLEIDSRFSSPEAGDDVGLRAGRDIHLTEVDGSLELVEAVAGRNIRITVRETADLDEDLNLLDSGRVRYAETGDVAVNPGRITATTGWIELRIGDDFSDTARTTVTAGLGIDIHLDDVDADGGWGANTTFRGFLTPGAGSTTRIFGNGDADHITFDQTHLGGFTRVYGSNAVPVAGASPSGDGEDEFIVRRLQTMTVGTLTLDGQGESDHYIVETNGTANADRNYVVNALDTGAPDDGVDVLTVKGYDSALNGTPAGSDVPHPADDIFLLRSTTAIAGETSTRPAFVALLHGTMAHATAGTVAATERINYDAAINGRLEVFGLGGNDHFAADDNSAITTLDGGAGSDTFQIGQLYGSKRNADAIPDANDRFDTIATTRGWLSPGITSPLTAKGGSGDDTFVVYANQAVLRLEGDDDNDLFIVRAFALAETCSVAAEGTQQSGGNVCRDGIVWRDHPARIAMPALTTGFSTAAETEIRTGAGSNQVQYNINAPVSIDGGNGFDKVVVLGTEFADHIVVTSLAVYGAGLSVTYKNIEVLEIDGLEGDDVFDVLSTPAGLATRVIGGLGSDLINVGGDVVGDVFSRDIEGSSGAINHLVTSGDWAYDRLVIDGVDLSVARPTQGIVIIVESAGSTQVLEGGTWDSYEVVLQKASTEWVYITVSAARSSQEEEDAGADSVWITDDPASFERTYTDYHEPGTQPHRVPKRAIVLAFRPGETTKTVYVRAPQDTAAEGDRVVVISHSVLSTDPLFDDADVRNVEVLVRDDDLPALVVTPIDPVTGLPDAGTLVLEGALPYGVVDAYLLSLAVPATGDVVVELRPADPRLRLSSADTARFTVVTAPTASTAGVYRVTFTAGSQGPIRIELSVVDDYDPQDPRGIAITHTVVDAATTDAGYAEKARSVRLDVKVLDNDSAGVIVTQTDGGTLVNLGTPGAPGAGDTYTLRLTSRPTAEVRIAMVTDGQTDIVSSSRAVLQAVGTTGKGLFTGTVVYDAATRTIRMVRAACRASRSAGWTSASSRASSSSSPAPTCC